MTNTARADRRMFGGEGDRAFLAVAGLAFAASVAATISLSRAAIPICGGGTKTIQGTPAPEEAAEFLSMWLSMMIAMMLPSLVPILWRYRRAVEGADVPVDRLTALLAAGYFCVQTAAGLVAFAIGALPVPSVPLPAVLLMAGLSQFTGWKSNVLRCCRSVPHGATDPDAALRQGLHLGLRCVVSSAGLMAVLLSIGMMDLVAMVAVTALLSLERLAPAGWRVAPAIGLGLIAAGLWPGG